MKWTWNRNEPEKKKQENRKFSDTKNKAEKKWKECYGHEMCNICNANGVRCTTSIYSFFFMLLVLHSATAAVAAMVLMPQVESDFIFIVAFLFFYIYISAKNAEMQKWMCGARSRIFDEEDPSRSRATDNRTRNTNIRSACSSQCAYWFKGIRKYHIWW